MKLELSQQIFEKTQISSFIKIRSVGTELFHEDRRTDLKLIVAFRNCAKAPKNSYNLYNKRIRLHTVFVQGGSNMTGTNCDLFTHK